MICFSCHIFTKFAIIWWPPGPLNGNPTCRYSQSSKQMKRNSIIDVPKANWKFTQDWNFGYRSILSLMEIFYLELNFF